MVITAHVVTQQLEGAEGRVPAQPTPVLEQAQIRRLGVRSVEEDHRVAVDEKGARVNAIELLQVSHEQNLWQRATRLVVDFNPIQFQSITFN